MFGMALLGNFLVTAASLAAQLSPWFDFLGVADDEEETPPEPGPTAEFDPETGILEPALAPADFAEALIGTSDADTVSAEAGENLIAFLGDGHDTANGGTEDDTIVAGAGDDTILLREGDDTALGGDGDDRIYGGLGDDTIWGGAGNDTLSDSRGDDTLHGGAGDDMIEGRAGNDTLTGGSGDDRISGDTLFGGTNMARGVDTLDGGAGNDTLFLGDGDTGTGGTGADTFSIFEIADPDEEAAIVTDFDPEEDHLRLHYLPEENEDDLPVVAMTYAPDSDTTDLMVDGQVIASLFGDVSAYAARVELVAQ